MMVAGLPAPWRREPGGLRPPTQLVRGALLAIILAAGASGADPAVSLTRLRQPQPPSGATLFTSLESDRTGISAPNRYADPRMWGDLHQEFKFGAIGTGVAIGDYDADGLPDVFIVSKSDPSRLYRNLGDWRFEDTTESAGLSPAPSWWQRGVTWAKSALRADDESSSEPHPWSQGATFADIDNDGDLDLYVCRFGEPNQLFVNQGDGTFREEAAQRGLDVRDASSMAAFADFDRDGWLDVFVQTNLLNVSTQPTGQADYLFRNNRDGTFTNVTSAAGIRGLTQGHSATWWDFDQDGWPDLYGAHDFAPPDTLYRNNRDGTFTNVIDQFLPHTPHSAMGADLGDVNNDGWVDLFVADMAATTAVKDQRGMAKIRTLLRDSAATDEEPTPQVMHNALYLGTGTGRLREAAYLAGLEATDWTWSVLLHDLDNDGNVDVHVTNGMVRELHNADLVQRMSASESVSESNRLLKMSPPLNEANLAFRNLGDLRFESVGKEWGLDQRGVSFGAAAADFDQDGDLDLVFTNYERPPTVLRNDSTSGHRAILRLQGTVSNRWGVGALVRIETRSGQQVRQLVLARGYLSSAEPLLHFGLGEDDRIERLWIRWPSGIEQSLHDLPANHRIVVREPEALAGERVATGNEPPPMFRDVSDERGFQLNTQLGWFDETAREPLLPFRQDRRGPALAVGHLNQDERVDVVLSGSVQNPLRLLLGGGTAFAAPQPLGAPRERTHDGPVLIFDANGDGANDVWVSGGGTRAAPQDAAYQPKLWLNRGEGRFELSAAGTLPDLALSAGAVAAADFDHDGDLDVFLGGRSRPGAYPLSERSALLRNDGGKFEDVTAALAPALATPGIVNSACWTDIDDDGWPDLLLAIEWGTIRYFRNQAGRGFLDDSAAAGFTAAGSGWWTALAASDFNADGRLDYLAGNNGLNTPYHASVDAPTVLYRGDFTGTGRMQLLEARLEDGRELPRRSRNELAAVIPTVGRRFPRHDLYARATLAELVGEERLAAAERYSATELRSGVFLSTPSGRFVFRPLPHSAQIAPIQGVLANDLNGDAHTDLVLLQNSHAPIAQVGRFDGGTGDILLGDGAGNFVALPSTRTGLVVPGDGEALSLADLNEDHWADLLVTRTGAPTLAWLRNEEAALRPLEIVLKGRHGNHEAIGASIRVELSDGTQCVAELHAGGSGWGQSAEAAFFSFPSQVTVTKIVVRWPDGSRSEHSIPATSRKARLSQP